MNKEALIYLPFKKVVFFPRLCTLCDQRCSLYDELQRSELQATLTFQLLVPKYFQTECPSWQMKLTQKVKKQKFPLRNYYEISTRNMNKTF